jgi:CheY-like chemotaxis protein
MRIHFPTLKGQIPCGNERIRSPAFLKPYLEPCAKLIQPTFARSQLRKIMTGLILIVDDDPVRRRLLEAAVVKSGYEAIAVDRGEAALEALDGPGSRDVAVVILDLVMPGLDGNGVLREMRERGIQTPIIIKSCPAPGHRALEALSQAQGTWHRSGAGRSDQLASQRNPQLPA